MKKAIADAAINQVNRWYASFLINQTVNSADNIFIFHDNTDSFYNAFRNSYDGLFKPTLNLTLSARAAATSVQAFCTPDNTNSSRKIHVQNELTCDDGTPMSTMDIEATFAHEYLHFLSHPNFYPGYYRQGKQCANQVEGITEHATYLMYPRMKFAYRYEQNETEQWISDDQQKVENLLDFMFSGDTPPYPLPLDFCAAPPVNNHHRRKRGCCSCLCTIL